MSTLPGKTPAHMGEGTEGGTEHSRSPTPQSRGQSRLQKLPRLALLAPGGPRRRLGTSGFWGHSPDQTKSKISTFSTGPVGGTLTYRTIHREAREPHHCGADTGSESRPPKWPTVVTSFNPKVHASPWACCLHIPGAKRGTRRGGNLNGEPPGSPGAGSHGACAT